MGGQPVPPVMGVDGCLVEYALTACLAEHYDGRNPGVVKIVDALEVDGDLGALLALAGSV